LSPLGIKSKAEAAAAKLRAEQIDAHAVKLDVTNPGDYKPIADFIEHKFGTLDILVNDAGIMVAKEMGVNDSTSGPKLQMSDCKVLSAPCCPPSGHR